jgi:hypothetical protein
MAYAPASNFENRHLNLQYSVTGTPASGHSPIPEPTTLLLSGAHTHEVLATVLRTIQQRQLNASVVFSDLLRALKPITALAQPPSLQ